MNMRKTLSTRFKKKKDAEHRVHVSRQTRKADGPAFGYIARADFRRTSHAGDEMAHARGVPCTQWFWNPQLRRCFQRVAEISCALKSGTSIT